MDDLRTLQQVRKLLTNPMHWAKGQLSMKTRNWYGDYVDLSWCMLGAINFVRTGTSDFPLRICDENSTPVQRVASLVAAEVEWRFYCPVPLPQNQIAGPPRPDTIIAQFNDHPRTSHTQVLAAFDRAIAAEQARRASPPFAPEIEAACERVLIAA
jgi:hypothetical protein